MSFLDDIIKTDASFGQDEFGECVTYLPIIKGVPQWPVKCRLVVVRVPPSTISESQGQVKQIHVFLPRSIAPRPQLEHQVHVPWRYGETPMKFAIKELGNPDAGGTPAILEWIGS